MNTKALESVIVVAVHVAHQKVKDGEVHQVQQTPTLEMKKIVSVKVQEFIIILLLMITITKEIFEFDPDNSGERPILYDADLIIGVNIPNDIAIVRIRFPLSLPPLVVAPTPWVSPSFPENHFDQFYLQLYVFTLVRGLWEGERPRNFPRACPGCRRLHGTCRSSRSTFLQLDNMEEN